MGIEQIVSRQGKNMFEPVQNCFTFYCPDGQSSAHVYDEQDAELDEEKALASETDSHGCQQSLALPYITENDHN
ncbi:MAG TPA: hypothetical protein ENK06_04435 [Gammaproteobacteria bacterium]|nr:hypothetical protein [Gammaproteobacteria bacterium]